MNKTVEDYTIEIDKCECDSEKSLLYTHRAKLYQNVSNYQLAIDDFNEAVKLDPNNDEANNYLKYIYEILDYRYMLYHDV